MRVRSDQHRRAVQRDVGALVEILHENGIVPDRQPELDGLKPEQAWGRFTHPTSAVLTAVFYLPPRISLIALADLAELVLLAEPDEAVRADLRILLNYVNTLTDGDITPAGIKATNEAAARADETAARWMPRLIVASDPNAKAESEARFASVLYLVNMARSAGNPAQFGSCASGFAAGVLLDTPPEVALQRLHAAVPVEAFTGLTRGGQA